MNRHAIERLVTVFSLLLTTQSAIAQIPELIESHPEARSKPIWISEAFVKEEGHRIAWDLLGDQNLKELIQKNNVRRELKKSERGPETKEVAKCQVFKGGNGNDYNPGNTTPDLVKRSTYIVTGTVINSSQGFLYGRPGTVFEILRRQSLKSPEGHTPPAKYLVFMSVAEIRADAGFICATNFRLQAPPQVGATFLLFLFTDSFHNDESTIVNPPDKGIFYENPDGELSFPPLFSTTGKERYGMDNLLKNITRLIKTGTEDNR